MSDYTLEQALDYKRVCNGCTACCTGTLTANIYGHEMSPGRPCHFKTEGGCAIYQKRPQLCKDYTCAWLNDTSIPEWMAPKLSNIVLTNKVVDGIPYLSANESVDGTTVEAVLWLVHWALQKGHNLSYRIRGATKLIGSTEFLEAFNK